ncbi:MAG: hypothetical protein U0326_34860 [Polyangiales bacterium]
MTDQFTPRTVVVVALASLVAGFVTVFGGGMVALRSRARTEVTPEPAAETPAPQMQEPAENPSPEAAGEDGGVESPVTDDAGAPAAPVEAAGVTITPIAISRCFAGMAPIPIAAEHCGRLPELDQHFASRAAQIAACANGARGRLAFVMDFRFSNQHVGAWGGPASTVPNAGPISLCVRRATAPLPLATIPHTNDRYIGTIAIDWQ